MKKNRLKLFLALGFCVLFLASAALGALPLIKDSGRTPAAVRDGVVLVYSGITLPDGSGAYGSGTGWAIGIPGQPVEYFVTNGHVVEYAHMLTRQIEGSSGSTRVYFSEAENDYVVPQIVYYSAPSEKDIAILKIPTPTTKRQAMVLRRSDTVDSGEQAFALGFPGVSDELQKDIRYDITDVTITSGVISKRVRVQNKAFEAFQMDVMINPGNSGGPLVDAKGFVLGVNTSGLKLMLDESTALELGVNYSSIADQLIRILEEERIAHAVKGDTDWMMAVFFPLAAVALALAILFLFQHRKQAALAAAGTPGGGKAKAAAGPAGAGSQPVLRGVNGKFAGEKFGLSGARLTLGRDSAKCNIVFDTNTPGISSIHCMVYYDAGSDSFMLTDNGSTYGTFLGNGKKLTANVPETLAVGDSFYLADTANRFIVTKE